MKHYILAATVLLHIQVSFCQPNCNIYKLAGKDSCYQACLIATSGLGSQGSSFSQLRFDRAIELCPLIDYAWMEKAVPYLKRGDFITWSKLINKAVELNPIGHLGYRGWCKYQFLRDYLGAIQDIEQLDSMKKEDIGYCITGDYHLNIAKALCYKAIGQKQKAIDIIELQLAEKNYTPMNFDYLHLAVLKWEIGDPDIALILLDKSIYLNDYYAENYYYKALIFLEKGKISEFKNFMVKAKSYYMANKRMFDPYMQMADQIYLIDIENALSKQ
jgi:tetratricopeptide (TPR) repeat protein